MVEQASSLPLELADQYLRKPIETRHEHLIVAFGFEDLPNRFLVYHNSGLTRGLRILTEQEAFNQIDHYEGLAQHGSMCTSDILQLGKRSDFIDRAKRAVLETTIGESQHHISYLLGVLDELAAA